MKGTEKFDPPLFLFSSFVRLFSASFAANDSNPTHPHQDQEVFSRRRRHFLADEDIFLPTKDSFVSVRIYFRPEKSAAIVAKVEFCNFSGMKKYGLQLRVQQSQQKKQPTRPPIPTSLGFHDDDDDDVEREISRQASKNKALKDIEEQHKKALKEDPSVFDYDGVYDEMKEKAVRPLALDRQERKSKYIQTLMEKAKERERQHDIIYERKLAKERSTDDHLFADKDKFVTSAYKKKLAEQAKWLEEERLRQLREEKEDVTKKNDMSDFYFNLSKNVAFGAEEAEARKQKKQEEKQTAGTSEKDLSSMKPPLDSSREKEGHQGETSSSTLSSKKFDSSIAKPVADTTREVKSPSEQPLADEPKRDHHKRSEDAVAAAKERFLARKKAKEQ